MYTLTYTLKICAISLAVNINKLFGKVFLTQKTRRYGKVAFILQEIFLRTGAFSNSWLLIAMLPVSHA